MSIAGILLWLHVVCGSTGLLSGTVILVAKKGNKLHKKLGKVFLYSMLLGCVSAIVLSVIKNNSFLFSIGVFTLYLLLTGQFYLRFKKKKAKWHMWLVSIAMLVTVAYLLCTGVKGLLNGNIFNLVLVVFGAIALLMLRKDYSCYRGKSADGNFWLATHLQRMTAAYIASVTAVVVVNNTILPGYIAWLLPTVIGVPLIVRWTGIYVQKAEKQ